MWSLLFPWGLATYHLSRRQRLPGGRNRYTQISWHSQLCCPHTAILSITYILLMSSWGAPIPRFSSFFHGGSNRPLTSMLVACPWPAFSSNQVPLCALAPKAPCPLTPLSFCLATCCSCFQWPAFSLSTPTLSIPLWSGAPTAASTSNPPWWACLTSALSSNMALNYAWSCLE